MAKEAIEISAARLGYRSYVENGENNAILIFQVTYTVKKKCTLSHCEGALISFIHLGLSLATMMLLILEY